MRIRPDATSRGRGRRVAARTRRLAAFLAAALAGGGAEVMAQGLTGGGPPGVGHAATARGSAVDPAEDAEPSAGLERFGGLEGGEGRRVGTAGAPARSRARRSPGDPEEARLGPPIGASGTVGGEDVPGTRGPGLLGGRMGRAAVPESRPREEHASDRARERVSLDRGRVSPPSTDALTLAVRPRLAVPADGEDAGPGEGLTLDDAVETLLRRNLDVCALRYEIPKAEADVLTAGLRGNPIIYGDAQLVPYGHYTEERPGGGGGQPQYDFNVSLPLDVSGKRRARVEVARRALGVAEAQLQDEVRRLIDQLYGAFVNVLAARETVRYGEAYLAGMDRLLTLARDDLREAEEEGRDVQGVESARDALDELISEEKQARHHSRRASQSLARATRTLAQLLYLPPEEARALRVKGKIRERVEVPDDAWLVEAALSSRPDLAAYRIGVRRADADVGLARANRLSDVYLVYQPYTFQDGRAFGTKGTYSYGFGVNAALPLFNRNQGNIARAKWNAAQSRVEAGALEYEVAHEVLGAADALRSGLADLAELERETLPAARRARDDAYRGYRRDTSKAGEFLDEQRDYDEVVRQYRDALVQARQDMLELNTAVGLRVMP